MKIDYLGHSGFFAETEKALLLFDYSRGDLSFIGEKPQEKPLFVFVSHAHGDHFNKAIFDLDEVHPNTKYLLAFDVKGNKAVKKTCGALYLDADRTYKTDGLGEVTTLASTDEGVAFLVKTPDGTLFHAGDLNYWNWDGEPAEWLNAQKLCFEREIGKLAGVPIDAAFVVLDDRLEDNFADGLKLFLSVCSAKYVLPMHFWKDGGVVRKAAALFDGGKTVLLDTANESHWEI